MFSNSTNSKLDYQRLLAWISGTTNLRTQVTADGRARDIQFNGNRRYNLEILVFGQDLKLTPYPEVYKEVRRLVVQAPTDSPTNF